MKPVINKIFNNELLKLCAQSNAKDIGKNKSAQKLNWPHILQKNIKEGIAPLFYDNLSQFKYTIPQKISERLEQIYLTNAYRNIRIYKKINTILSSFNKANLKVIPLKGIFLAEKIYENIAIRAITSDIDLLIKKEDLQKVNSILEGLGYKTSVHKKLLPCAINKSHMNSINYFKNDESLPCLHIHWHIVNISLPTYMYTKNIKIARLFKFAKPITIANTQALELMPEHLIIYLAEHALKHSFDRLILLSDIDAVIKKYNKKINWQKLVEEAEEFEMQKQVFYGLYFTNYFLKTNIPDYVLNNLKPKKTGFLEKRFIKAIKNNQRGTKLCYFVYLALVKGHINKLKFIVRTLLPPPSTLALFFNLNKPKITVKDYFSFLSKQLSHLKNILNR